jgi:sugar phosphate isomerase/epimerase
MKRRNFLATISAAGAALGAGPTRSAAAHGEGGHGLHGRRRRNPPPPHVTWTIFSRHLQWLTTQAYSHANPFETGVLIGEKAQEIGFKAVDLTVRSTGHVDPNLCDIAVNLPAMVKGVRSTGAICRHITTNIELPEDPIATFNGAPVYPVDLLRVASHLGIEVYRWGGFGYNVQPDPETLKPQPFGGQVLDQLDAFADAVKPLARLNRRYRMTAIYHSSSGGNNPRSVWDLVYILRHFDPDELAINFDIGHMVRESTLSAWRTNVRVAMPHIRGVGMKDGAVVRNTNGTVGGSFPLAGTGMVQWREFFQLLLQGEYAGPAEAQYEYNVTGLAGASVSLNTTFWADHARFVDGNLTPAFMTEELKKDITYYKSQAALAGWTADQQT